MDFDETEEFKNKEVLIEAGKFDILISNMISQYKIKQALPSSGNISIKIDPEGFFSEYPIIIENISFSIKPKSFSKNDINLVGSRTESLGKASKYAGTSADYASFGLAFLGADPSGSMMKFSQMNKLLSRFRFLNI